MDLRDIGDCRVADDIAVMGKSIGEGVRKGVAHAIPQPGASFLFLPFGFPLVGVLFDMDGLKVEGEAL